MHTSRRYPRGYAAGVAKASAAASPLPLAGEGQGGGEYAPIFPPTLSPPLSRKREREQTESAAPLMAHTQMCACPSAFAGTNGERADQRLRRLLARIGGESGGLDARD